MAADPDKTLITAFGVPGNRPTAPVGAPPPAATAAAHLIGLLAA
ncbi:hypothetical protein [Streptomyces sp. HPF1205]|nr:hypothetical protein [Streptomyces sp. HPF1205]